MGPERHEAGRMGMWRYQRGDEGRIMGEGTEGWKDVVAAWI